MSEYLEQDFFIDDGVVGHGTARTNPREAIVQAVSEAQMMTAEEYQQSSEMESEKGWADVSLLDGDVEINMFPTTPGDDGEPTELRIELVLKDTCPFYENTENAGDTWGGSAFHEEFEEEFNEVLDEGGYQRRVGFGYDQNGTTRYGNDLVWSNKHPL